MSRDEIIKAVRGLTSAADARAVRDAAEQKAHQIDHNGPAGNMARPGTPIEEMTTKAPKPKG